MGSSVVTHELDRVPAIFGCMMMAAFFCFFSHKGAFAAGMGLFGARMGSCCLAGWDGWLDGCCRWLLQFYRQEGRVQGRCAGGYMLLSRTAPFAE